MLKRKTCSVKADTGTITGYAASFIREPDSYGDVVRKGAFADCIRQLKASGKTLPLLFNHKSDSLMDYIGTVTDLKEDDYGLKFTAVFDDTTEAQKARRLAQERSVTTFSFAYEILDQETIMLNGRKANELRKLNITEVSLTLYPAQPASTLIDVKNSCGTCTNASKAEGLQRCNQTLREMLHEEQKKRRKAELMLHAERLLKG